MIYGFSFKGDLAKSDLIKSYYSFKNKIRLPSSGWVYYHNQQFYRRKFFVGTGVVCAVSSEETYSSIQGPDESGDIEIITKDSSKPIYIYVFATSSDSNSDNGIKLFSAQGVLTYSTEDSPCSIIDLTTIKSDPNSSVYIPSSPDVYRVGSYGFKTGVLQEWFYSDRVGFSVRGGPIFFTTFFKTGANLDVMQYRQASGLNNVAWNNQVKVVDLSFLD